MNASTPDADAEAENSHWHVVIDILSCALVTDDRNEP